MADEERLIQWLLATGGDTQAPGADPQWLERLRQDPAWQELAEQIRHWDQQLGRHLREGAIPQRPLARLRQRLLAAAASEAIDSGSLPKGNELVEPAAGCVGTGNLRRKRAAPGWNTRRSWTLSALAVAVAAVVLLWWLWPPASLRLAKAAWQMLQRPAFNQPEKWITRRQPPPQDEVPPVLRVSRRLRWRAVQVQGQVGVVHHLINHETQSVQAWLFVLHGVLDSLPSFPPKRPQWQQTRAVAGCWADPRRQRTYILIVPGTLQQYRFWITSGPLAKLSLEVRPLGSLPPAQVRGPSRAVPGNRPF